MNIWAILRELFDRFRRGMYRESELDETEQRQDMTTEHDEDMNVKESSTSKASRPDSVVRARAENSDMLAQEQLVARDSAISPTRRPAGPVEDVSYPDETESAANDAPETRLEEPPEEKA